jgi:nucleoside-diphosphate-sugar epimerase
MPLHVIVGAGVLGSATASLLSQRGHHVRLLSRSGGGPARATNTRILEPPAAERPVGEALAAAESLPVERLAIDAATDASRLEAATSGAAAIYNCANPPYDRWTTDWPPLATALLYAAERSGAVLVTMSNLYGYGPLDHPMTERDPLAATSHKGRVRAEMWMQALAAHTDGRARVTEARAADYFGPGVSAQSHIGERTIRPLLAGSQVRLIGNPDVPHSWTYVPDIAAALVMLGTDSRTWGRAWHVPTGAPLSQRAMLDRIARMANAPQPRIQTLPGWALRAAGVFVPMLRELDEIRYQFEQPFVMDSSDYQTTFGVAPTPIQDALQATLAWWMAQGRAAA